MRGLGVLLVAGCTICLLSVPAIAEKRVALVIGNSAYENVVRLDNPANDAAAMTTTLKEAGFDVVDSRRNLKIADMRRAFRDFADKSRDADVAVVYYAGHGIEVDGNNYLIPIDAALERDLDIYDEAFSLDRILISIEPAKQLRLVMLDACRDNPFAKTMKRTTGARAIGRGLAKVEPTSPNTLIAFASKAGSTASDGDSKNSPFTSALVRHIATPGLDLRKAFGYVRDDVLKNTSNKQEPYVYGSLGGDDVPLVPAKSVASQPMPNDQDATMRRDYEFADRVGTKPVWDAFIERYPSGFYTALAKAQRDKLVTEKAATGKLAADKLAAEKTAAQNAAAGSKPPEQPPSQQVASLPAEIPAPDTKKSSQEIARSIQVELKRVGCFTGSVDGEWNAASRRSLELFNRRAGTKLEEKLASLDVLDVIKAKSSRVCPLICDHGSKVDGESCVQITCGAGFFINDNNECEKKREKPLATREEVPFKREKPKQEQKQAEPSKPQASGQIICTQQGCRAVRPGCRITGRATTLSSVSEACN
jgi:hypothetical protein